MDPPIYENLLVAARSVNETERTGAWEKIIEFAEQDEHCIPLANTPGALDLLRDCIRDDRSGNRSTALSVASCFADEAALTQALASTSLGLLPCLIDIIASQDEEQDQALAILESLSDDDLNQELLRAPSLGLLNLLCVVLTSGSYDGKLNALGIFQSLSQSDAYTIRMVDQDVGLVPLLLSCLVDEGKMRSQALDVIWNISATDAAVSTLIASQLDICTAIIGATEGVDQVLHYKALVILQNISCEVAGVHLLNALSESSRRHLLTLLKEALAEGSEESTEVSLELISHLLVHKSAALSMGDESIGIMPVLQSLVQRADIEVGTLCSAWESLFRIATAYGKEEYEAQYIAFVQAALTSEDADLRSAVLVELVDHAPWTVERLAAGISLPIPDAIAPHAECL